ncbi:MAG: glycosyltransferase family 1 protein [Chloroflexi bacterium]|nr:glycosyltransferase family 1 protein [Chloroflexota bacterium]
MDFKPRDSDWPASADLVVAYGPFSRETSMLPAVRRLRALPRARRPIFVWWLTEGVPPLWLPRFAVEAAGRMRVAIDAVGIGGPSHRLRIFGELRRAQTSGVLDVLVVTSASRAAYLRNAGFEPVVVPLGYQPERYGRLLDRPRDIDVCFLGNMDSPRRRRLVPPLVRSLARAGVEVSVQSALYGEERTRYLNRCRIVLNVLRAPQDFVGQRFVLAAANGALTVSEPLRDREPFVDGKHIVVAPLDRLVDTVLYYLAHEDERACIAGEAHRFVTQELTVENSCGSILAHTHDAHSRRNSLQG